MRKMSYFYTLKTKAKSLRKRNKGPSGPFSAEDGVVVTIL